MEITFSLSLPRDGRSVPVVRRITGHALSTLGVDPDCVSDLQIALSEACSNVLQHSGAQDDYAVYVRLSDHRALIEVHDRGSGFAADQLGRDDASTGAESGRGIQLMRALVDEVRFVAGNSSDGRAGTIVHLEKDLAFLPGSAAERFAGPVTPV